MLYCTRVLYVHTDTRCLLFIITIHGRTKTIFYLVGNPHLSIYCMVICFLSIVRIFVIYVQSNPLLLIKKTVGIHLFKLYNQDSCLRKHILGKFKPNLNKLQKIIEYIISD